MTLGQERATAWRAAPPPRLPPAVHRRHDQPVRHPADHAGAAGAGGEAAGRQRAADGAARVLRVPRVPGHRPARRRLGRPLAQAARAGRQRPGPCPGPRLAAAGLGAGPADLPAAARRRPGHRAAARCSSTSPTRATCPRSCRPTTSARATPSSRPASRSRMIGGPALAGVAIKVIGAPLTIAADALSFVWSAFWIRRIQHEDTPPPREDRRPLRRGDPRGSGLRAQAPAAVADHGDHLGLATSSPR